jgi:hypothetical protein
MFYLNLPSRSRLGTTLLFACDPQKILAISAFLEFLSEPNELALGNKTLNVSNLLRTRDPKTLTFFQGLDKRGCLKKAVVRPHVEPCEAAPHSPDIELAPFKIDSNEIRYLKFSASGRLQLGGDVDNISIAKVETCYRPVRTRYFWLLFNRQCPPLFVKFDDAVPVREPELITPNCLTPKLPLKFMINAG